MHGKNRWSVCMNYRNGSSGSRRLKQALSRLVMEGLQKLRRPCDDFYLLYLHLFYIHTHAFVHFGERIRESRSRLKFVNASFTLHSCLPAAVADDVAGRAMTTWSAISASTLPSVRRVHSRRVRPKET